MILRTLTLAGGLAGAAGLSQFPEYSQQYTQRLSGAVDELSRVIEDFDRSAAAEGMTRETALEAMTGTDFVDRRRQDMAATIARHQRLSADLSALRGAGPFTRAYRFTRLNDADVAKGAASDFRPAVPLSFEGVVFAALGFVLGGLLIQCLARLMPAPPRRRTP